MDPTILAQLSVQLGCRGGEGGSNKSDGGGDLADGESNISGGGGDLADGGSNGGDIAASSSNSGGGRPSLALGSQGAWGLPLNLLLQRFQDDMRLAITHDTKLGLRQGDMADGGSDNSGGIVDGRSHTTGGDMAANTNNNGGGPLLGSQDTPASNLMYRLEQFYHEARRRGNGMITQDPGLGLRQGDMAVGGSDNSGGIADGRSHTTGGDMAANNTYNNGGGPLLGSQGTPASNLMYQLEQFFQEVRRRGNEMITQDPGADLEAARFESSNSTTTLDDPRVAFDNQHLKLIPYLARQVALGFIASNCSHLPQPLQGGDSDDHHISIGMPSRLPIILNRLPPPAPLALITAIVTMCLLTLIPAISTLLYKPARGVIFSHYTLAYYVVLSIILALALGEGITAYWLSRPGGSSRRRLRFGGVVLLISIFNFTGALGIAGFGLSGR